MPRRLIGTLTGILLPVGLIVTLAVEVFPRSQSVLDLPGHHDTVTDGSEFVFARLRYGGLGSFFSLKGWDMDWPAADAHFMIGIDRLSNIRVVLDDYVSVSIMDPALFDYPFVYAVEVGYMELDQDEADRLREYMLRGGFLVVDDFWGSLEWRDFERNLHKIFPDKEVEEIPMSHPVFHMAYDIDEIIQVPYIGNACAGCRTWEQDGYYPYALGVFDDARRLMMMIHYNTDLGDAWEHADNPYYPNDYSGYAYRMGVNFILYSMTH
jgi:hypothetical protein